MSNPFQVYQIINLIDSNLPKNKIEVIGEVSDIKISHGNMYFTLKDKYSSIKCIIWKNNNKSNINEGDNVIFEASINLYKSQGNLNLIINKIISIKGLGLLYNLYNQYKLDFENKGYFDINNKKKLPLIIKKILIITSNTGAAIQDIFINIQNNKSKLDIEILDTAVQGNNCPNDIINKLSKYNINQQLDLILITRGGGSYDDLFGFSKPELIEYIYNLKKTITPVICSAIGHQIDNPLLDMVCDISAPTPSLASQLIIDTNKKYLNSLKMERDKMRNIIMDYQRLELDNYRKLEKSLEKEVKLIINIKDKMKENLINMINYQLLEMDNYNQRLLIENIKMKNQILIANKNLLEFINNGKYDKIIRLLSKNKKIKIKIEDKEIVIYDYKYI
ncbi:exodeoxyribonuclease VII large subunit [Chlorella virus XW01]|nr:exodeoxyribonuclease VII large subunit [Chlorella virus XW01]